MRRGIWQKFRFRRWEGQQVYMWNLKVGSAFCLLLFGFVLIAFAPTKAQGQAPPNATYCAKDFERCRFDGEREVIYGANGIFVRKTLKGGAVCLPETFGVADPVPNVVKSCYVSNAAPRDSGLPASATFCAKDGQVCAFEGERFVYYGAKSKYISKLIKGGQVCLPQTFGIEDPLPNVLKSCYIGEAPAVDPFANRVDIDNVAVQKPDNRTLTLNNFGGMNVTANVYKTKRSASNDAPIKSLKWIDGARSASVRFGGDIPLTTELDVEITMKVMNGFSTADIVIYRGTVPSLSSVLCFEVNGTIYDPSVKTCENTVATEMDHITVRNDAGALAFAKWDYSDGTPAGNNAKRSARTDDMLLGYTRKMYVPRDAGYAPRTLTIKETVSPNAIFTKEFAYDAKISGCYKVWGDAAYPKVSPCSIAAGSRTIKFWNNSADIVRMQVEYDNTEVIRTNNLIVTQTDSLVIPPSRTTGPIKVTIQRANNDGKVVKELNSISVPYSFKGELCYKLEGGLDDGVFSNCDDVVGDTFSDSRKIRYQNDSGFNAEMLITYYESQLINGTAVMMPRIITTGMLMGLGRVRTIAIPAKTYKGMPISIVIRASGTLKNDVFSTTLPADFIDNPQPCFKVWGTLFSPQASKCDQ